MFRIYWEREQERLNGEYCDLLILETKRTICILLEKKC